MKGYIEDKKMKGIIYTLFILTLISCQNKTSEKYKIQTDENDNFHHTQKDYSYYKSKDYQIFSDYGFVVKAPAQLKDISKQADGDFALNYGVVVNENNPDLTAFYQLIIIKLPVGYNQKEELVQKKLLDMSREFNSYERIKVDHNGYDGYLVESNHNGYEMKGEIFHREEYIYSLIVISNNNLEKRFNQFTNSLKFINDKKENNEELSSSLLDSAESKGFKRGIIENSINTKWSDFNDKIYYTYIKTLKSGMKLYRAEFDNMMMEIYVLDNIIKIQSSSFILGDSTSQILEEMNAWIMSCTPLSTKGNLSTEKIYQLKDFEVVLKRMDLGIFYMISAYN